MALLSGIDVDEKDKINVKEGIISTCGVVAPSRTVGQLSTFFSVLSPDRKKCKLFNLVVFVSLIGFLLILKTREYPTSS